MVLETKQLLCQLDAEFIVLREIVSLATGRFALCVGVDTIAQSHTTKLVITATVEFKFKGALSDSFNLALYTVSKEKYFLYLTQTPVRHQAV